MPGFAFNPPVYPPTERDIGTAVLNEELERREQAMQPTDAWDKAFHEWNEKNDMKRKQSEGKEI